MAPIFGKSIGGGSSILTTPIQVTGLKATGKDGGVALSIDSPTEASYPYLKDYWVVWKKASDGPIQHPYDGAHMTFAAGQPVSGQALGNLTAGSTLKIVENNVPTQFLVLKLGYPTVDDANVLLLRKDLYGEMAFGNSSAYSGSTVDNWCQGVYTMLIEESVRNQMVEVSIASNGASISRKAFILSATELGYSGFVGAVEGTAIPYFNNNASRIAQYNGAATDYFTRTANGGMVFLVPANGGDLTIISPNGTRCARPAFCLPFTVQVSLEPDADGDYTLV